MDCLSTREKLGSYLDGELPPDELVVLELHLARCNACAQELEHLKTLVLQLQTHEREAAPLPPSIWDAIESKLDRQDSSTRDPILRFRLFRKPLAVAASLAFLLGAGVFVTVWLNPASRVVQAETIDYRLLLDGVKNDADRAVDRFLEHYRARSMGNSLLLAQHF